MKFKYKTVSTRTLKGLKQAERLKNNGWKIGAVGWESIDFWKPETVKKG